MLIIRQALLKTYHGDWGRVRAYCNSVVYDDFSACVETVRTYAYCWRSMLVQYGYTWRSLGDP